MIKNNDESVENNRNPNWRYFSDYPHRNLIYCGSGSCRTKMLLNLIKPQRPDFEKMNEESSFHPFP